VDHDGRRGRAHRGVPPDLSWLLVPLAVEIGWQLHLRSVWGELPVRTGKENVGTPVVGVVRTLLDVDDAPRTRCGKRSALPSSHCSSGRG
jgi:hypothetical protein